MYNGHSELKFSNEQGVFDRSHGVSLLLALLFIGSLFIFLHFREIRVDVLDLGSTAPRYIVAQVDIDFFDEQATIIQKQAVVGNLGKIYHLFDKEIQERRVEFEKFFISDMRWHERFQGESFNILYDAADRIEKALRKLRFTDPRTFQKMKEIDFSIEMTFPYLPHDLEKPTVFPTHIWEIILKEAFQDQAVTHEEVRYILNFFEGKSWTLEEDIPAVRALHKMMQSLVPDKYTHISAGSRIIDQGDKVTARHLAILQAMKEALSKQRNLSQFSTIAGSLILSVTLTLVCIAFFRVNFPEILRSNYKLSLVLTVVLLTMGYANKTEFFFLSSKSNLMDIARYPLFVPFAAILLCSLLNGSVAAFITGFLTILLTVTLSFEGIGFMITNLTAALVAILSTRGLLERKEIFVVCGKAWVCCAAVLLAINLYSHGNHLLSDLVSTAIFMLLTSILVVGLLPLLESLFHIMTDVTLIEYMNPNHELLRRLSIEAPGTYQHSVALGNLTEAAALAIGANGLFCRVATLYHDIGKMATPQYFTENQQKGMNIHQLLTPQESAQVIMAHVTEGASMARKAGLPEQFIDVINEHHGTTLVYYFYRKQLEKMGGDRSQVDERMFRYAGPKPYSKEAGIIMIADSLEAASRSLEEIDEESLAKLLDEVIREKQEDGQFDRCLLTCADLATVKATLIKTMVAYRHSRVKYPKRETEKKS